MSDYGIKKILMDMDSQKYKACWAANPRKEGEPPNFSRAVACLNHILRGQFKYLETVLNKPINIREWLEDGKLKIYISALDRSNFRYDVATIKPYKGNRGERPLFLEEMQDWLIRKWRAIEVSGMEADDAIGIESAKKPRHTLIFHEDKDLWQLEGWHAWFEVGRAGVEPAKFYEAIEKEEPIVLINTRKLTYVENPGTYWLERSSSGTLELFSTGEFREAQQMIQGDTSDNIPKIVKEVKNGREIGYGDMEVYEMFKSAMLSEYNLENGIDYALQEIIDRLYEKHYPTDHFSRQEEIYKLIKIKTTND